jgi:hypothetical protein
MDSRSCGFVGLLVNACRKTMRTFPELKPLDSLFKRERYLSAERKRFRANALIRG